MEWTVTVTVDSPPTSFGVRLSRIHRKECVTNEPQRTSAGGYGTGRNIRSLKLLICK